MTVMSSSTVHRLESAVPILNMDNLTMVFQSQYDLAQGIMIAVEALS